MKLQRWKCGSCNFEWFEPSEFNKSDRNVNHGCPQGCDDAGKVIDMVEATDKKKEWICWILSREDIDITAQKVGIDANKLSDDAYDDIARNFIKGFEWANEDWRMILEEAVEEVLK